MPRMLHHCPLIAVTVFLTFGSSTWAAAPIQIMLASAGEALLPIAVGGRASAQVRDHAEALAHCLGRIAGASFHLAEGDGRQGIAVGVFSDFPALNLASLFDPRDPLRREDYLLRTHPGGLLVIGATELAVQHAVWGLLHELGYRHFFAGDAWECVPRHVSCALAIDRLAHPDYATRFLYYSGGTWHGGTSRSDRDWINWRDRNRVSPALSVALGHNYARIIAENQAAFDAHPEYVALTGQGERGGTKFCIANPGLRQLVVGWATRRFRQSPSSSSLSLEPSDGAHWCVCDACRAMGSVTDRVVTLGNDVAEAVNRRFASQHGPKYVGFYAYNRHSPPPTIDVHPRTAVFVATWFLRPKQTVEMLLEGWGARTAGPLGIYEYPSGVKRHRMLPARARVASTAYLARTVPFFHRKGARFYMAGTTYSFGPYGPGLYLAARMLWDLDEARRVDELKEDFLERAFGPARERMRRFYALLETDPEWAYEKGMDLAANHAREVEPSVVRGMYEALHAARQLAPLPDVQRRLDLLVQYTRYVDLYRRYYWGSPEGEARQKAFDEVAAFAYRIRYTRMIGAKVLLREPVSSREPQVTARLDGRAMLRADVPFSREEIDDILSQGLAATPAR